MFTTSWHCVLLIIRISITVIKHCCQSNLTQKFSFVLCSIIRCSHLVCLPSFLPVVSRGTSFCLERVVEAEQTTETVQEGSEEICAVRLESSALPVNTGLNQITEEEETRPG